MKKIVFSLLFAASLSQASILIEPYAHFQLTGDRQNNSSTAAASDTSLTGFGGRLGYSLFFGPFVAFDYETFSGATEKSTGDVDYSGNTMYLTAGFSFPILLRFWAGYAIGGEIDQDSGTDYEGVSGLKFGLAYKFMPFVNIYLEYRKLDYDETSTGATADVTSRSTVIGVSIPI